MNAETYAMESSVYNRRETLRNKSMDTEPQAEAKSPGSLLVEVQEKPSERSQRSPGATTSRGCTSCKRPRETRKESKWGKGHETKTSHRPKPKSPDSAGRGNSPGNPQGIREMPAESRGNNIARREHFLRTAKSNHEHVKYVNMRSRMP